MSVKMIRPNQTICADILSYNVPLDYPVYDPLAPYAEGSQVVFGDCYQDVYKAIAATTGNQPDISPLYWVKTGPSNYWALFDDSVSTQTSNPDSIEIEIALNKLTNAVALINVDAESARFEVWDIDDTKIMDTTVSLRDYGVMNWYDFYFEEIKEQQNYVSFDVPTVVIARGKLTLTKTGEIVSLGSLVYGSAFEIGHAEWGVGLGIKDYSSKGDDPFGNATVIKRGYKDLLDVNITVDNSRIGLVKKTLTQFRSTPAVWVIDQNRDYTINFGFYNSFNINLSHQAWADCSLKLEGLI